MLDLSDAKNENEKLALSIFKAMEDDQLLDVMAEICTEDFVWANSGLPTLNGQQAVRDQMAKGGFAEHIPILKTMASFSADLTNMASAGDVVFTERVDHHWDAEGRDLMTPYIAGVIEIRDGKIAALRDYYDVVCYEQKPTAPNPAHALTT
jgi:limonene-1,2-epoxide hydrolase